MESFYAKYLKERTDDKIIETEQGFCTYRYLNEKQVYIIDIYILPEFRQRWHATSMANVVCHEAKAKGCSEVIGTVVPSCKNANESIKALIAYGMSVISSSNNLIVFKKDL